MRLGKFALVFAAGLLVAAPAGCTAAGRPRRRAAAASAAAAAA